MSSTHNLTNISATPRCARRKLKYKRSHLVWPIDLDEVLLQGLAEYRLSSNMDLTSMRYPKRNIWISGYIFKRTGKTRTAKQVCSRIQKLKATSADTKILGLIGSKCVSTMLGPQHPPRVSGESSMPSSYSPPPTPVSVLEKAPSPPPLCRHVANVAVALVVNRSDPYCGMQTPAITLDLDENGLSESSHPTARPITHRAELQAADCLSQLPPEIRFSAQSLQDKTCRYRSVCSVYCDNKFVYTDLGSNTYLHLAFFDEISKYALYSLDLVPDFWAHILSNPKDVGQYRINQWIISVDTENTLCTNDRTLFDIQYSLETGCVSPKHKVEDQPPLMAIGSFFLESHHHFELPVDHNHNLPTDSWFGLAYPQYKESLFPDGTLTAASQHLNL